MKLGGHDTFYPRPGWLTKGLLYLTEGNHGVFSTAETADALGVGKNMAKSIGWWLNATGLAQRLRPSAPLELSDFGQVVAERDPFMEHLGTWWLVHVSAQVSQTGTSLPWFFAPSRPPRFDRSSLVKDLSEELARDKGQAVPIKSVQREVSTILKTFAVPIPRPAVDPEDNLGSPFHRLHLLRHVRATDRFERAEPTPAPPEALAALLSVLAAGSPPRNVNAGTTLSSAATSDSLKQAGAILGYNREALLQLAENGAEEIGKKRMHVQFHAAERVIIVKWAKIADWAKIFYNRVSSNVEKRAA